MKKEKISKNKQKCDAIKKNGEPIFYNIHTYMLNKCALIYK